VVNKRREYSETFTGEGHHLDYVVAVVEKQEYSSTNHWDIANIQG